MVHEFKNLKFNDIKNDLIEYVYNERKNDPKGKLFSNRGGWQSNPFRISDENNMNMCVEKIDGNSSFFSFQKYTEESKKKTKSAIRKIGLQDRT